MLAWGLGVITASLGLLNMIIIMINENKSKAYVTGFLSSLTLSPIIFLKKEYMLYLRK
jgi:hypothetical protein